MSKNDLTHFQKICCKIFKSVFDHFGILCIKGLIAKVFLKIKTFKDFFKITNKRVLEIFGSKSK